MDNSLFYINFEPDDEQRVFIDQVKAATTDNIDPIYVVSKPIIEKKNDYEYAGAFAILVPKHKIMFFDFGKNGELFDEYVEDFIEDIGYIAKKYEFLKLVGRPRQWRENFCIKIWVVRNHQFLVVLFFYFAICLRDIILGYFYIIKCMKYKIDFYQNRIGEQLIYEKESIHPAISLVCHFAWRMCRWEYADKGRDRKNRTAGSINSPSDRVGRTGRF